MVGSRHSLVLPKPPQHCKMSKENPQEVTPKKNTPSFISILRLTFTWSLDPLAQNSVEKNPN